MEVEQWLDTQLGKDIWNNKYRFQGESFDQWLDRVSGGDTEVKRLIIEKKFIPAGRTLTNRNTGTNGSLSNCYSHGYVPDSLSGIMEVATNLALTYKAQGGQGLSMSMVRPKGTKIAGVYESDGIVPFINIFNTTTASISQGNARKGALMISLSALHKEIDTFIHLKANTDQVTKANLSVEIDDEFMQAVQEYYATGKVTTIHMKQTYEGNTIEYDVIPIEVYRDIIRVAYDWGEPGNIFTNRFRNYNIMEFIDDYKIITGNPCGEQSLPEHAACNLASMNLSAYVKDPYTQNARFLFEEFRNDVHTGIRVLDDIVDEGKNLHALEEQRIMAENYRNIGLGIMGLGDMFFKLGIRYGSQKSKDLLDKIMSSMFCEAVLASNQLAIERGTFPKYSDKVFESTIIKNHFSASEIEHLKKGGLRNCSLLSIAPTGSIGTMLDVTTGIEPAFQISYKRKTESLHKDQEVVYDVFLGSAAEYSEKYKLYDMNELPDYFVSASDIHWRDRIDLQAIAQEHVDAAISSTINLPNDITLQDIEQLYLYGWQKGLKGLTIFRDGCARLGILTNEPKKEKKETQNTLTAISIPRGIVEEVPSDLTYRKYKLKTGCGKLYFFVGIDEVEGRIYDVFTNTNAVGGCVVNTQANSRLLSAGIRGGIPIEYLIEQLDKSGTCASYQSVRGHQNGMNAVKKIVAQSVSEEMIEKINMMIGEPISPGKSCSSSIGIILRNILKEFEDDEADMIPYEKVTKEDVTKIKTQECTHSNLKHESGCVICPDCGWSKCD